MRQSESLILLHKIQRITGAWRAMVCRYAWVRLFIAGNIVCLGVQFFLIARLEKPHPFLLPALAMLATLGAYIEAILYLIFTSLVSTEEGRATPACRFVKYELVGGCVLLAALQGSGSEAPNFVIKIEAAVRQFHTATLGSIGFNWQQTIGLYVLFLLPLALLLAIGNRSHDLGFRRPCALPWAIVIWSGMFVGGCAYSVALLGPRGLLGAIPALLLAALPEEFFFRAVVQTRIEASTGSALFAIIFSSLIFGAAHLRIGSADCVWQIVNAFGTKTLLGLVFGHMYYRTRSLWPGVLLHAAYDVALFSGFR